MSGGLHWPLALDLDEVANELTPVAFDLVEECDPRMSLGRPVTQAYYEGQAYAALNTLVSIALLPETDKEGAR